MVTSAKSLYPGTLGVVPRAMEPGFVATKRKSPIPRDVFDTLLEAKVLVARWRRHYNGVRPHSA